ncbi:Something about silencing protein 10 [Gryllus bimaculatus]|nr:Something about silencing protein 10 [Gryllus bimaculatus]
MSDYELTDSDYDYDENEKILLQRAKQPTQDDEEDSEEEVLGFQSSEEEGGKEDFDEDIENYEDDLPNVKAWGQRKKIYYDTDYIDQDFGGFQGQDAEDAENEEQEARAIQERLLQELDETDYMLDTFAQADTVGEEKAEEKIKTDVSGLSKRDKLALFAKESPEFPGLIEDFKEKMAESEKKLQPIVELINNGKIPNSPICKFIKTKYHLILNYSTNILYYLLLKARHMPVQNHPVIQRLFQYRQLLKQLESIDKRVQSQIDEILEKISNGEEIKFYDPNRRVSQKKRVDFGDQVCSKEYGEDDADKINNGLDADENGNMDVEEGSQNENARRAITYEIAKNRGLAPYRKKELRNPRVKHRMKYRKAQIRRKGQIREPRKELQKYGGEISGIKIGINKSIKLK